MLKPSSLISIITLIAFLQAQIASVWALPTGIPEQQPAPTLLYLGDDPYTQALLKLEYDGENKSLEWQLLNHGLVLSSQSHAMPETTESVDSAVVYDGDLIVVAGRSSNQNWFLRALNSQGEFQWQRSGEGRIYDLAFSDDGKELYAVGVTLKQTLLIEVDAQSGVIGFSPASGLDVTLQDNGSVGSSYKQVIVTDKKEVVVAEFRQSDGLLKLVKWRASVNPETTKELWQKVPEFCLECEQSKVNSVALKNDQYNKRFISIVLDEGKLYLTIKKTSTGENVFSKTITVDIDYKGWNGVLRVEAEEAERFIKSNIPAQTEFALQPDSKLQISNSGCQLLLNSRKLHVKAMVINICDNPKASVGRHLLQSHNETDPTNATSINHRDNFELFATIVGVIGGVTLVTGLGGFIYTLIKKHSERVSEAIKEETQRRIKESNYLQSLYAHKPSFLFDPSASTFNINLALDSNVQDCGLTDTSSVVSKVTRTLLKSKEQEAKKWLLENKEIIEEVDSNGSTVLHYLAQVEGEDYQKRIRIAELLLRSGANARKPNNDGHTPLYLAANSGDVDLFELMLIWTSGLNFDDLSILFHVSVRQEQTGILLTLLNRGFQNLLRFVPKKYTLFGIDKRSLQNEKGETLLHESVNSKHLDVLRVEEEQNLPDSPDDAASSTGSDVGTGNFATAATLRALLDNRIIDVDAVDYKRNSALHLAVMTDLAIVKELLRPRGFARRCANVNLKNHENFTPLHKAVEKPENSEIIEYLLSHSPDVHAISRQGSTPLDLACARNNISAVILLLGKQASLNSDWALLHSARNGYIQVIGALYRSRIKLNINAQDSNDNTALHLAAFRDDRELRVAAVAKLPVPTSEPVDDAASSAESGKFCSSSTLIGVLFLRHPKVYVKNKDGNTPLHIVAIHGTPETARVLLQHHRNMYIVNNDQNTPLHLAVISGNPEMIDLFLLEQADYDRTNSDGNTPLHLAVQGGHLEIVRKLIESGADVNRKNSDNKSPSELANTVEMTALFQRDRATYSFEEEVVSQHGGLSPEALHDASTGNIPPEITIEKDVEAEIKHSQEETEL